MKKLFYIIVIPLLLIVNSNAYSQSNKGTEFWTAFMAHIAGVVGDRGASMVLYITSDVSTTGTVQMGNVQQKSFSVAANQVTFVEIPASVFMDDIGIYTNKSIHITSAKPIAVYAHIYAQAVSGATLLLPVSAMGKEYISLNYAQHSNANPAYSDFAVIATEDNTTVEITPTAQLKDGKPANVKFIVNLNKGDTYQGLALPETDLTGTKIQSVSNTSGTCKKIAVFSGSSKIYIGCSNAGTRSSDNLFQQVYPTSTWGKNYVAVPLKARPYDVYRIVLSDPATNVTLNGTALSAGSFINGLYYEFKSTTPNVISADKPIQVIQYSPTQNETIGCTITNGDVGDPEMIYLSPVEQGLNHVTLYSTGYYRITQSYINVVIPTAQASTFSIDGVPYYGNFTPIPNTSYSYAQIGVNSGPVFGDDYTPSETGTHTINAAVPFNAIAYGFGSDESYGYAAGANLQDLNEYVALQDPQNPAATTTAGCSNLAYILKVTLPYQTTNIQWKIDGVLKFTDNNPVVKANPVVNGKTLYTYEYPTPVSFAVGSHPVVSTVFNPVADVCGSNEDVENNFSITDPPVSSFDVAGSNCLGDPIVFTDKTPASATTVKTWLWDFGDNTTSAERNPTHTYLTSGDKSARLTVTDFNGCETTTPVKTVHVATKPTAAFTFSAIDCAGQLVSFNSSTSQAGEGTIQTWAWDFGDGTISTDQNPTHTYATANVYNVKLVITNSGGCVSDKILPITVSPLPVASFVLPDVCIYDQNSQFTSTSTIADNTESEFTYLWDFGDPASGARNTSSLKNPTHTYSAEGSFTVKLTVTSKYGCVDSKSNTFTVNGSNPGTAFHANKYNCSGDAVTFVDDSKPDFGSVTKLRWYFDLDAAPAAYEEFDRDHLHSDLKYVHTYPVNTSSRPITYHVKLRAYTGTICYTESVVQDVIINPQPVVSLYAGNILLNGGNTTVPNQLVLCQNDAPITVTVTSDIAGISKFTGKGITADGKFDPKVSGSGTFDISYNFTATDANTACFYTTTFKILVNEAPAVQLPAIYSVLEGDQVTLMPVAGIKNGATLSYKWTPATGLSRDNIASPVVTVTDDVYYTLTVSSDIGCLSEPAKTLVKVLKKPVVPNAFTPNGDGINDTWDIKYLNTYPNATVEIFNRYGNKVYYSKGYTSPWDGRLNGGDLPVGTYYYIVSPNSGRKPIVGYLTIIR